MTKFSPKNVSSFTAATAKKIEVLYSTGRGCKTTVSGEDAIFMSLSVVKHGGQWDFLVCTFNVTGPNFERVIMKNIKSHVSRNFNLHSTVIYKPNILWNQQRNQKCFTRSVLYRCYLSAILQIQRQRSRRKKCFMEPHKLYGHKVEVWVNSVDLAIGCSVHHPGSVSNLEVFCSNCQFRK